MSIRAVIVGLGLAFAVAGLSNLNDSVIHQTYLTGNFLPPLVFGVAVLFALIRLMGRLGRWSFQGPEIALIAALGLAGGSWAGNSFGRAFTSIISAPLHWLRTDINAQSHQVLAYLPNGSPHLAPGQVREGRALVGALQDPASLDEPRQQAVLGAFRRRIEPPRRQRLDRLDPAKLTAVQLRSVVRAINHVIDLPTEVELETSRANQSVAKHPPSTKTKSQPPGFRLPIHAHRGEGPTKPEAKTTPRSKMQASDGPGGSESKPGSQNPAFNSEAKAEAQAQSPGHPPGKRGPPAAAEAFGPKYVNPRWKDLARQYQNAQPMPSVDRQRLVHAALTAAMPRTLSPMPRGAGVLLAYGERSERAIDQIRSGERGTAHLAPTSPSRGSGKAQAGEAGQSGQSTPDSTSSSNSTTTSTWSWAWSSITHTLTRWGHRVPWSAWAPTLKWWMLLAASLGIGCLCLSVIVHPQWTRRERLAYPVPRVLSALLDRGSYTKMFWYGFGGVIGLHTVNALHAYFPVVPEIPLHFDFNAMRTLLPNASKVSISKQALFQPKLFPGVIAFATLVTTEVALSMGISGVLWIFVAATLLGQGFVIHGGRLGGEGKPMMMAGAFIAAAIMMVYIGRRYYGHVLQGSLLGRRFGDTPGYARWAGRVWIVSVIAMSSGLWAMGLDWYFSLVLALGIMMIYLIITRIVVESGVIYTQAGWAPVGLLLGMLGFEAIGPTAYLIMAIVCAVFLLNTRDILMPQLAHGLYLIDNLGESTQSRPAASNEAEVATEADSKTTHAGAESPPPHTESESASGRFSPALSRRPPRGASSIARFVPWQAGVVIVALGVTLMAVLFTQYTEGVNLSDTWPNVIMPRMPFWAMSPDLNQAWTEGTLAQTVSHSGLIDTITYAEPSLAALRWLGFGFALYLVTSLLRLKVARFPLHPVLFLVWGTTGAAVFAPSFILGYLLKKATVSTTGASGFNSLKPMLYGVIAGELIATLATIALGLVYFACTGTNPPVIRIFPV